MQQLETTYTKMCRQKMSILFNKICINEKMLPKYTHTHTHTHIYIYIYIYIVKEQITYLGSSVSSPEKDIDTRLMNAWTAIDKLSVIWKSDLTDKMKQFLPSSGLVDTAVWMHHTDANKTARKEARRQLYKDVASNIKQVLATTSHKTPNIRPPTSQLENYPC